MYFYCKTCSKLDGACFCQECFLHGNHRVLHLNPVECRITTPTRALPRQTAAATVETRTHYERRGGAPSTRMRKSRRSLTSSSASSACSRRHSLDRDRQAVERTLSAAFAILLLLLPSSLSPPGNPIFKSSTYSDPYCHAILEFLMSTLHTCAPMLRTAGLLLTRRLSEACCQQIVSGLKTMKQINFFSRIDLSPLQKLPSFLEGMLQCAPFSLSIVSACRGNHD